MGLNPLAFRYLCLNANYRSKLNFTWEVIKSAQVSLDRLLEGAFAHKNGADSVEPGVVAAFKQDFTEAVNDDLNIPKALGVVWNIIRYEKKSRALFNLLADADFILGLNISSFEKKDAAVFGPDTDIHAGGLGQEIEELVNQRQQARKDKNWKLADEIRGRLKEMGVTLEDTPQGVKIIR